MTKAAIYARYSTDRQTEDSIQYQLDACQNYCEQKGLAVAQIYTDAAITGTNTNRCGLQKMLSECKQYQAIVIYDQSRLSRDIADWFTLRETLAKNHIQLHSCQEHLKDYDTNPTAFLSEGVRALFNHQFVLDTRQKVLSSKATKVKEGAFLGGVAPLGYDIVNGEYVINPLEAHTVIKIYPMYAAGASYGKMIDELDRISYKTKRGCKLGNNSLKSILENERYIGVYFWNKRKVKMIGKWVGGEKNPNAVRIENKIPKIIDENLWKAESKRMADNKNKAAYGAKREYLLSGLLQCGHCGGAFVGITTTSSKKYETKYYTCATKRRLRTCTARNINADDIEALVVSLLKDKILNSNLIEITADFII